MSRSQGIRSFKKQAAALMLGCLFMFCLAEISLRILGASYLLPERNARPKDEQGPDTIVPKSEIDPNAYRILCIGNSHTQGAATAVQSSYPAELENLLLQHYPHLNIQVFNTGRGNWNTSEILENLPRFLVKYKPHLVFVMMGEPNSWNFRFFYRELRGYSFFLDNLRSLKVVRLLDLLMRYDPKGEVPLEKDIRFPGLTLPWFEFPSLATSWTGYLDVNPDLSRVPKGELLAARKALERWTSIPAYKERRAPLAALLNLQLYFSDYQRALATAKRLLNHPSHSFDEKLWHVLSARKEQIQRSGMAKEFEDLKRELEARIPSSEMHSRLERILYSSEPLPDLAKLSNQERLVEEKFLEFAVAAAPSANQLCHSLANSYRLTNKKALLKDLLANCLKENPFEQAAIDELRNLETISIAERGIISNTMTPPLVGRESGKGVFGENPRIANENLMSAAELDSELLKIQKWVVRDLRRAIEMSEDFGAKVILQTFPRYRLSKRERWPDALIRSVARDRGVPLSDTSALFEKIFAKEESEPYYYKAGQALQDDHLNVKGNRVVAELMYEDMLKAGIVPHK